MKINNKTSPLSLSATHVSDAPILVSVILPIYDRADCLRHCMECLAAQARGLADTEVWIIADGSPNPAELEKAVREPLAATRARVHFAPRPKKGPGIQRNWAMRQARGEIFLFLNDDIEFGPDFLEAHIAAHRARPGHAVSGNWRWKAEGAASGAGAAPAPFMHWIAHAAPFYFLLRDLENIGWEYVHTLNFSIHRRWVEGGAAAGADAQGKAGEAAWIGGAEEKKGRHEFCEDFPDPAFEDTEWGLRLEKSGLRIAFAPRAILYHCHTYAETGYWSKTRMKARSAQLLLERHPQVRERILGRPASWLQRLALAARAILKFARGEKPGPPEWERREASIFHSH